MAYNSEFADSLKLKCVTSKKDNTYDSGTDSNVTYCFQALNFNLLLLSKCEYKQMSFPTTDYTICVLNIVKTST